MKNYTYTLNEGFNSYFKKLDEDFNSHKEQLLQELEEVDPFDEYTEAAEYFNDLVQEAEEEEGWFSEPSGQGSIWSMYIYTNDDNEIKIKGSTFDRNLCNIASNATNEDDFKNKYKQYIEKHLKKNKSLKESSEIGDASKVEISGGDGKNVFYFYVGPSYKHNSVENIIAFAQENLDSCRGKSPEEIEAGHMFWGTDSGQFEGFYNGDTFILFDDINKLSPDIKQDALRYCKKPLVEAASKKVSADHKWGDKSVKSQLALPENQAKLNSFLKPGRDWKEMRKEFVDLINSLDCTDKNKKQTIMKINGVRNEGAFYSTVATYMTGIKTESVKLREAAIDPAFHVIVEYKDGVYEDTINRDFWFGVLQPALEKDDNVVNYRAEKASAEES